MSKTLFQIFPFIILFLFNVSFAQVETKLYYTAQADVSTTLAIHTLSANADLDFLHNKKIIPSYAGIRLGLESYYVDKLNFTIDGSSVNSQTKSKSTTYKNVDLLGRYTISGSVLDFNICSGVYYNKTDKSDKTEDGIFGKITCDVELKLIKNIAGILFRFAYAKQNYGGLGFYFAFTTRDK